jgi:Integrase zinc binding domain
MMTRVHDHPTAAHPGRDETLCQLRVQGIAWPGMKQWVADYVKGCAIGQQSKILTHRIKTALYRILTPSDAKPFQQIAMDLITGLPPQGGKDAILIIVDHGCSRATIFLPCNTTITGPEIAQLYLEHIFQWFGLPQKIISDHDP